MTCPGAHHTSFRAPGGWDPGHTALMVKVAGWGREQHMRPARPWHSGLNDGAVDEPGKRPLSCLRPGALGESRDQGMIKGLPGAQVSLCSRGLSPGHSASL